MKKFTIIQNYSLHSLPIAVLFGSARAASQGSARRVRRAVRDWARVKPCAKKREVRDAGCLDGFSDMFLQVLFQIKFRNAFLSEI